MIARPRTHRTAALWLGAAFACVASRADAGLRPLYGGEIVITTSAAPQTFVTTQAWNLAEIVLANATGTRLSAIIEGPPMVTNGAVRFTIRRDTTWPDGSVVDAHSAAKALRTSLTASVVGLPPFTFREDGQDVVAELPGCADPMRYLDVPWLRLPHGPFRVKKGVIEADPNAPAGRPFADGIRVEVKESRKLDPVASGIALLQPGEDGRAVLALPRPESPARDAIVDALSTLDRAALVRLFVRTASHVPDGWPLPAATPAASPVSPVVLLVDSSERDQRTIAERLQVLLSDHHIAAHIASVDRAAYFERISRGEYDLALVDLPPAPAAIQAATLTRMASGSGAVAPFWSRLFKEGGEDAALRNTAATLGAALLYMEDGGIARGARLRDVSAIAPWDVDLANAWIAPPGVP